MTETARKRFQSGMVAALSRHLASGQSPRLPPGGEIAWQWFCDLCATRSMGPVGPNPISHAEIGAYANLYRWPLETRHIEVIKAMDQAYLAHAYAHVTGENKQRTPATGKAAKVSALSFDAVFG